MIKRVLMLAVGSLALVACGPGAKIDGKQGAAEALLAASQPTKSATDSGATPVDLSGGVTWKCPEGGSAEIKGGSLSIGTGGVTAGLTLKYNGCGLAKSDVGVAVFNGSMTFSQNVMAGSSGVGLDQAFKGRVTVQGAYDDFIDADVKQIINVGDLGTAGKGVSMSLKGTITTSENTFTFDEMLTVMAGTISAKVTTSKN
jgi:hypothetical protein